MSIHILDEHGTRRTYADRKALSRALRDGEISGSTRVYVPAQQDYALLGELFDLDRLREGNLERRGQAAAGPRTRSSSRSRQRSRGPAAAKATQQRLLLIGSTGLVVLAVLAGVVGHQVATRRAAEEAAAQRRQAAADLAAIARDLKRTVSPAAVPTEPPASAVTAASPAPSSATATAVAKAPAAKPAASRVLVPAGSEPATVATAGAQMMVDHLAEVRALNERYQQSMVALREGLMTPESMGSASGRKANRDKLARVRAATDSFFTQMKQSKQRLIARFEQQEGRDPERERKMADLVAFLGRLQAANAEIYDRMRDMNDYADQHPPVISGRSLLFETEPEVAGWAELNGALERSKAELRALQEEGRQMQGQGLSQLQQQVDKLKDPR